jgi:oligoribonuclease NrnB/cAMP/cGMP phosphodiesterase (DHH superfamily)
MQNAKKVKHFTHTDFDGVGCAVISMLSYGKENVDVEYCDYDNIDNKVSYFLDNPDGVYSKVLITDISVNEDVAKRIQLEHDDQPNVFQLLDHHNTAKWLNKYDWAFVYSQYEDKQEERIALTSGTSILFNYLNNSMDIPDGLADFAEQARRYDTWEWDNIYGAILPKELNDYLYMVGRDKFIKTMISSITTNNSNEETYFDVTARSLLNQRNKEIKEYIRIKNKQLKIIPVAENEYIGFCFAEQHVSELGNELCKMNPDIKYVMILDMGTEKVSFRTIRDDIDLGQIAKAYNGGGHPKASGGKISDILIDTFVAEFIE